MLDDQKMENNQASMSLTPSAQAPSAPNSSPVTSETASAQPSFNQPYPTPPTEPSVGHTEVNQPQTAASGNPEIQSRTPFRGFWKLFADAWRLYLPNFWQFLGLNLITILILIIPLIPAFVVIIIFPSNTGEIGGALLGAFLLLFLAYGLVFLYSIMPSPFIISGPLAILAIFGYSLISVMGDDSDYSSAITYYSSAITYGILALSLLLLAILLVWLARLLSANFTLICRAASNKEKVSFSELLKIGRHNLKPLLITSILASLLVSIGFPVLIVPGLIIMAMLSSCLFVVVFEDIRDPDKAIVRSYELVRGYGREMFDLMLANFFVFGLFSLFILFFLGPHFGPIFGIHFGSLWMPPLVVGLLLPVIVFISIAPIPQIMLALRYLDLRYIKEHNLPKVVSKISKILTTIITVVVSIIVIIVGLVAYFIVPDIITQEKQLEISHQDVEHKRYLWDVRENLSSYFRDNGKYIIVDKPTPLKDIRQELEKMLYGGYDYYGPGKPDLYLSNDKGEWYVIFVELKDLNDKDIKTSGPTHDIPLPKGYNYWITSE